MPTVSHLSLAFLATLSMATPALATTITPTFGAARAETVDRTALCANSASCVVGVETFNTRTAADFTRGFTTDFGTGGAITGTYASVGTPNLVVQGNDAYGGSTTPAAAAYAYPELFSGSYKLTLSTQSVPGVNYFGLWISALDNNNDLQFYSKGTLLLDFTPTLMRTYIAQLPTASSYYGNPENGQDTGEPFAFVNFFASGGTFDTVVFTNNSSGSGFESDNDTVAYRTAATTFGNAIPEPASLTVLAAGLLGLGFLRHRSRTAA